MFLMWLGEQITERGVGNGISMIIFAGIVSGLPAAVGNTFEQVRQGLLQPIVLVLLVAMLAAAMGVIVFIERGQRRVTVQYPKRQQGRQMFAAQKSYMPLKINMSGVIPPIFASSIILFPATLSQWFGQSSDLSLLSDIGLMLSPGRPAYMVLFGAAIVFFCFFYTALVFNPRETAENLKKSGAFIPGIRPGEQTAQYIDKVMTRLTVIGAVYITTVALMPELLRVIWQVPFYFGGTALLISVVVIMDFMAQVQAHMMPEMYKSLMQKSNLRTKRKD
jgi:preprotein translocase subunit SecY